MPNARLFNMTEIGISRPQDCRHKITQIKLNSIQRYGTVVLEQRAPGGSDT